MGKTAVIGHLRNRVRIPDHHIEIGQGGQRGTVQQRTAALDAAEHRTLQGGAKYGLGNRVQGKSSIGRVRETYPSAPAAASVQNPLRAPGKQLANMCQHRSGKIACSEAMASVKNDDFQHA